MHGLFLLKIKREIRLLMLFKNILDESNRKSNKMWVDKGSEFYNRSIKSWLQDINIQLYSTHNEKKLCYC